MFLDQAYEQHPFIQFYALECAANICSNNEGVEQFLQQNNVVPNLVRLINGKYNGIIDSAMFTLANIFGSLPTQVNILKQIISTKV